jgi:ribonucleotide reductase beta subunit family protein with ferritin-like domain
LVAFLRRRDEFCAYNTDNIMPKIWNMYKKAQGSIWIAEEIDLASDKSDWAKLLPEERNFIKMVLAFFAGADGIVIENLASNFANEIQLPEARCFYGLQIMISVMGSPVV